MLKIELALEDEVAAKVFRLRDLRGGSNEALCETLEFLIANSVDQEIEKEKKKGK